MRVGVVSELWRYPVKSMRGDRIARSAVTERWGLPGDRGWVVRDEEAGEIRSAKQLADLLQFHAHYLDEPHTDKAPTVEIGFPDGSMMQSDDDRIHEALSSVLGRPVRLYPRQPADDVEHYRRRAVSEDGLRTQLALGPEDPFPEFSGMPRDVLAELEHFASPRGTYFDALPLSLLTSTALDSLQAALPDAAIDARRFRKNIIVAHEPPGSDGHAVGSAAGHPEFGWVGRRLTIGEVVCEVVMPISRCRMVTLPQADLRHDRSILRSLARENSSEFGVYLVALSPGTISEGDEVRLS